MSKNTNNGVNLTSRETELSGIAWQCLKSDPQMDYVKMAELGGFKNPASASACWNPLKKKLMAAAAIANNSNDEGASTASTPAKKKTRKRATPGSSKRKIAKGVDDFDEEETPTKKIKAEDHDDNDGEDGMVKGEEPMSLEELKTEADLEDGDFA